MSLASLLSIARSALSTHQRAMEVIGHNVANASTPGYSRQRLLLAAEAPLLTGMGSIGRGVTDLGVQRARDQFLDAGYRDAQGGFGQADTLQSMLGQIDGAMGEPSDTGLSAAMDKLFASFSDLANNPDDATARSLVAQAGQRFSTQMQQLDKRLKAIADSTSQQMRAAVTQVNQLATQIAQLNSKITASGGVDGPSPDLLDQRDNLVDQLSALTNVQVTQHADGTLTILSGSTLLVDGAGAQALEVRPGAASGFVVGVANGGPVVDFQGGSLAALTTLSTKTLPDALSRLDLLAQTVVSQVNAVHMSGCTSQGWTGIAFFDPAGVTAGTINLSSQVLASPANIATSSGAGTNDGKTALALAALGKQPQAALGNLTFQGYYADSASTVGLAARNAADDATTQQTLVDQADSRRTAVTGVSVDEEMVNLIQQQQAYGAAAKLVTVADQMVQTILGMLTTA